MHENPLVIVISGPSGVGKDATIASLKESGANFHYVVTATTRAMRSTEQEGVDYYFLSVDEFKASVARDEFLEYAKVYGNYYGVLKKEVRIALQKGEDVILKVDVQGADTLKKKIPDAVFIFLVPPSINDLTQRLTGRNADSPKDMQTRIDKAENEMRKVSMFDYRVINHTDNLRSTAETVQAIVTAERCRVIKRSVSL